MSVFATDRRYSVKAIMYDNISFVIACGLSHINNIYVIIFNNITSSYILYHIMLILLSNIILNLSYY